MKNMSKVSLGQFFTPQYIAEYMVNMLNQSKHAMILEPSSGGGVFLTQLEKLGYDNLYAYEVDANVISHDFVNNSSFLLSSDEPIYDAVIGNPPYVRWKNLNEFQKNELSTNKLWKKYFNSLCDYFYIFILKSVLQLRDGGELIFICPDYWLSTKNAMSLRRFLIDNGCFEDIILFNESNVFDNVFSSLMIFKYKKGGSSHRIRIRNIPSKTNCLQESNIEELGECYTIKQFSSNEVWSTSQEYISLALEKFEENCYKKANTDPFPKVMYDTVGEICDIGNGMVSGLDKAFQMTGDSYTYKEIKNSIDVHKAKHLEPFLATKKIKYKFILDDINLEEFKNNFPTFYSELELYKNELVKRYNYNKPLKYWQWAFLRNFSLFKKHENKIFVPCKERISNKNFFRFSLVDKNVYPTQDVTALYKKENTRESIEYITAYLNSNAVFLWLKHKGVVKGDVVEFSEKPLSSIPFRKINWDSETEVETHDIITNLVKDYQKERDKNIISEINFYLEKLGVKVHYECD